MPATMNEDRPDRAWGVAAVPAHPYAATPSSQPAVDEVFDRPEALTGPLGRLGLTPAASAAAAATDTAILTTVEHQATTANLAANPDLAASQDQAPNPIRATSRTAAPPVPAPPNPQRSRSDRHRKVQKVSGGRQRLSRLRTIVVVIVLLAAAGLGGYQIIRQRLAAQAFVDLGSVVLTAEAVPVGFAEAVVVNSVMVTQHARVSAGQDLAAVTSAIGNEETLRAPVAGTVAAVKVGVGGVARGGEPIIMLYDQARLTFQADVPLKELRRMRLGMTAYVEGPGLAHRITATLDHVVPVVGAGQSITTDALTVVLIPTDTDRATVSSLVPGLRFNAQVDTNTAADALPAVNTG